MYLGTKGEYAGISYTRLAGTIFIERKSQRAMVAGM